MFDGLKVGLKVSVLVGVKLLALVLMPVFVPVTLPLVAVPPVPLPPVALPPVPAPPRCGAGRVGIAAGQRVVAGLVGIVGRIVDRQGERCASTRTGSRTEAQHIDGAGAALAALTARAAVGGDGGIGVEGRIGREAGRSGLGLRVGLTLIGRLGVVAAGDRTLSLVAIGGSARTYAGSGRLAGIDDRDVGCGRARARAGA